MFKNIAKLTLVASLAMAGSQAFANDTYKIAVVKNMIVCDLTEFTKNCNDTQYKKFLSANNVRAFNQGYDRHNKILSGKIKDEVCTADGRSCYSPLRAAGLDTGFADKDEIAQYNREVLSSLSLSMQGNNLVQATFNASGESNTLLFKLVQEQGSWKVDNIKMYGNWQR